MTKDYIEKLRCIAQTRIINDISIQGVDFFENAKTLGISNDLGLILAAAVAAELHGASKYTALKQYVESCIQDDVETMLVDNARRIMTEQGWNAHDAHWNE